MRALKGWFLAWRSFLARSAANVFVDASLYSWLMTVEEGASMMVAEMSRSSCVGASESRPASSWPIRSQR